MSGRTGIGSLAKGNAMNERRRVFRIWAVSTGAWVLLVTGIMAWPLLFPYVEPKGASFREDTFGLQMFDMNSDGFPAIEKAVADGALAMTELSEGFRLFTRGTMTRLQTSRRIKTAEKIVALYVAEERQIARGPLIALWAGLAVGLPLLVLGGGAALLRSRSGSGPAGQRPKPSA
jgi:hypothetical protein